MSLNTNDFNVFDIKEFPLVCFNQCAVKQGYAGQWKVEMQQLIENGTPFVMVYDHMRVEETPADWRQRGDWLIHHRQLVSKWCKGMVSIETDASRCEALSKMRKMFGVPHQVVSSRTYALEKMKQWLAVAKN